MNKRVLALLASMKYPFKTLNPIPGEYINSFYYPRNEVNNNSNVEQKATHYESVFWAVGGPTVN